MAIAHLELDELRRRPQRYWNADGLPELSMGVLWVLWGAALWLPELLAPGAWLKAYRMVVPLVLVGGGVGANLVTRKLKEKITFPRGGYVAWAEPSPTRLLVPALLAAAAAAGLVLLLVKGRTPNLRALAAPGCALLLALALLVPAIRWRLTHFLLLSAVSLVMAAAILLLDVGLAHGLIALFLVLGVVSATAGAVRLRAFLRRHPVPAATDS